MNREAVIACMPFKEGVPPDIKGSTASKHCSVCGCLVWVAPTTPGELTKYPKATFKCIYCVLKEGLGEYQFVPPSREQIKEVTQSRLEEEK